MVINNRVVSLNGIGNNSPALLCLTNNTQCCIVLSVSGEWYMPDGNPVKETPHRERDSTVVHLLRNYDATSPTGVFHCEIPDAFGTLQNIYVCL